MRRAFLVGFVSFVVLVSVGCGKISEAPDAAKLGVFASTNDGLKELLVYGEQQNNSPWFDVPQLAGAPTFKSVKALYLNMPGTEIMNSKVFVVPTTELAPAGPGHQAFQQSAAYSIPVSFETVKGNLYKVVVPELGNRAGSVLLFKVNMPHGSADRLYAINLGG